VEADRFSTSGRALRIKNTDDKTVANVKLPTQNAVVLCYPVNSWTKHRFSYP